MDEAVLRAIAKWPDVPAAYGWLSLDRRGDWHVKGARITNPAVIDFVGRNYAHDDDGRWFFQNGPQRVFVTLAYTPFVLRTEGDRATVALRTHIGQPAAGIDGAWLDEHGALLVGCNGSVGLIYDRDLDRLLPRLHDTAGVALDDERLEAWFGGAQLEVVLHLGSASVPVSRIDSTTVAARFGFDPAPQPRAGEPEC